MTAGIFHFTIEQGTDFVMPMEFADTKGTVINLTGCSAAMMIRPAYDDATPIVSLTSTSGIVMGGTAGTILVTIDSSVTDTLAPGTGVYDLKLFDSLGNPMRLIQGSVTISPAVTR